MGVALPIVDSRGLIAGLLLLVAAPGTLSLAWLPSGSPGTARIVTVVVSLVLGLLVGALGLLANPCVSEPLVIAPVTGALAGGTFAIAAAVGRTQALRGRVFMSVVAAGITAAIGFVALISVLLQTVFVLC